MAGSTMRVRGYREFMRATARADRESKKYVRDTFRDTGSTIRDEAGQRMASIDSRTAAGYKVGVRVRGVVVYQSVRKVTGLHPEYGALQMRHALIPALDHNEAKLDHDLERAMERVCRHFEARP